MALSAKETARLNELNAKPVAQRTAGENAEIATLKKKQASS
jgi:hypothetical protein